MPNNSRPPASCPASSAAPDFTQYDPTTASGCAQCRREAKARYRNSAARRAIEARYARSDKGRARKARYRS